RVFVSSTGDVQKERILADRVIRSVAAEFNVPVSAPISNFQRLAEENGEPRTEPENHGTLILCAYFLEYQRFQSDAESRVRIPNPVDFDLVISILWSRLGGLLDPTLTMPDGSSPGSGTEYEVAWALDHAKKNRGVPLLHVYRNCSKPTGVRSLYSAMELLTGVLCALGKEQRVELRRSVQQLSRPAGV